MNDPAQCFHALYDEYNELLYRIVRKMCWGDDELTHDLTQQTWKEMWEAIINERWDGKNPKAWLMQVARHRLFDHLRKTRKPVITEADPFWNPLLANAPIQSWTSKSESKPAEGLQAAKDKADAQEAIVEPPDWSNILERVLHECGSALTPTQRGVLEQYVACYISGSSDVETFAMIAQKTGKKWGYIKRQHHHALRKLKDCLKSKGLTLPEII